MTNPFRALQTFQLFQEIDRPIRDYPAGRTHLRDERVALLLQLGADPWGRGSRERHVLGAIGTATPGPVAVEAWFKAAGNMRNAPWERTGAQHPLITITRHVHQPDMFRRNLFLRVLDAGAPVFTPETAPSLVQDVFQYFDQGIASQLLARVLQQSPELLALSSTQAFLVDKEPWIGSLTRQFSTSAARGEQAIKVNRPARHPV